MSTSIVQAPTDCTKIEGHDSDHVHESLMHKCRGEACWFCNIKRCGAQLIQISVWISKEEIQ